MSSIDRIARRLASLLGVGRQTTDTNEAPNTPTVQVVLPGGELRSDMPMLQLFGFTSRPIAGADLVAVFQSGNRRNGVVVASSDQRYRPRTLKPGEAVMYCAKGSTLLMNANGDIIATPASGNMMVNGNLIATGTVTGEVDVIAGPASISGINHVHPGVQSGASNTQKPTG